jgi:hypothetical protein
VGGRVRRYRRRYRPPHPTGWTRRFAGRGPVVIIPDVRRSRITVSHDNWRRSVGVDGRAAMKRAPGSCRSGGREAHAPTAPWKTTEQFSTSFHASTGGTFLTSRDSMIRRPLTTTRHAK